MKINENTAEAISLERLVEWVRANEHRTWSHKKGWGKDSTHEIKYLRFHLDTRDMKIFHIDVDGLGVKEAVDFREEFDGDLMDLLEHKLAEPQNNPSEQGSKT